MPNAALAGMLSHNHRSKCSPRPGHRILSGPALVVRRGMTCQQQTSMCAVACLGISMFFLEALVSGPMFVAGRRLGVDVSVAFDDPLAWSCAANASGPNQTWAVVRAWHSYSAFDSKAVATLAAAKAAGLADLSVYMFPCLSKSAKSQVDGMMQGLQHASFNAVWIDIETNPSAGCAWSDTDFKGNCAFVQSLVNELKATGTAVGIYSSHFEWGTVMGNECDGKFNHLPLWFARYSGGPSCDDYSREPFGGWTRPFAKQYNDTVDVETNRCGIQGDADVLC